MEISLSRSRAHTVMVGYSSTTMLKISANSIKRFHLNDSPICPIWSTWLRAHSATLWSSSTKNQKKYAINNIDRHSMPLLSCLFQTSQRSQCRNCISLGSSLHLNQIPSFELSGSHVSLVQRRLQLWGRPTYEKWLPIDLSQRKQ